MFQCVPVILRTQNEDMWLHFYIEDKVGVSIINSISHCHTENALKKSKNQEIRLCFYIDEKVGVSIDYQ